MARTKVQAELIATNAISGTIIADNAITATHIATNSISGTLVQDSGIVTSMIAANNITSTKIVTDAVLTRHIADDQVTGDKLTNNITIAGTLTSTGAFTSPGIDDNGDATTITIDSSENVGIGTTSPASVLHVDKSFSGTLVTFHQTAGSTSDDRGLDVETSSTGTTVQRWLNSGSELMRVVGDGKVGIGTNSPTHHLHVNSGTTNIVAVFESSDAEATIRIKDSTGTAALKCRNDFRFNKSEATEMMRLNNDGKLIIGDTGSHVDDLLQIETPASGGGTGIQIRRNDSNSDQGIGRVMFGNNTDTDLVKIQATTDGATDSGRITIETQATGGGSTEKMRIDSDGMWRGELLNNDNTNPLGSGTNSGKLWSTSGNWTNVWQVTNDAEGAHYWIEIDIQSLDGYTSYGEIYKDRNGRWRIVQHRQAGTNFQVSSDNNYIQVNQSSGANQTNSSGNLKLVRIPGATA